MLSILTSVSYFQGSQGNRTEADEIPADNGVSPATIHTFKSHGHSCFD
jgi:hypothetical protein